MNKVGPKWVSRKPIKVTWGSDFIVGNSYFLKVKDSYILSIKMSSKSKTLRTLHKKVTLAFLKVLDFEEKSDFIFFRLFNEEWMAIFLHPSLGSHQRSYQAKNEENPIGVFYRFQ